MKTMYAILQDNQDGGYSISIFPTPGAREAYQKDRYSEDPDYEKDPEDEYQYGYYGEILVNQDGSMYGHFGQ